jgi:aryl-alcohol dehydrogenase-like predicted oxidoreductase
MMRSERMNVLFGARKVENVLENARAASFVMDPADLSRMTRDADSVIQNCVK